jgi:hypothetical protein
MIRNKQLEIKQLETTITISSKPTDAEHVMSTPDMHRFDNSVSKIVDLENEIQALIDELLETRNRIVEQIDSMTNFDYYNILSMRYVGRLTFEKIAFNTNWSMRKVFQIHGEALREFENLYGTGYLNENRA